MHLAVGGAVNGSQIYAQYPSLALRSELDLGEAVLFQLRPVINTQPRSLVGLELVIRT